MIKVKTVNERRCLSCKSEQDARTIEISLNGKNATVITLCDKCITSLYIDTVKIQIKEER